MNGEIRGDSRELEWIFLDGWLGNELKKKKEGGGGKVMNFERNIRVQGKMNRFDFQLNEVICKKKKIIADNINLY